MMCRIFVRNYHVILSRVLCGEESLRLSLRPFASLRVTLSAGIIHKMKKIIWLIIPVGAILVCEE